MLFFVLVLDETEILTVQNQPCLAFYSHHPITGWYVNSFSHARRVVLGPAGAGLPDNDPSVAYFDGESCVSAWALNGRGGGGGGVSGLYGAQTVPSVAGR